VTVLQSVRARAGFLASGAASFVVLVGGLRLVSGEPLLQPRTYIGIVVGVAMVALYLVLSDTRGGGR
jgi:hypothetical protein